MTIYFIEMENDARIKIGYTAGTAEGRMAQLQTGQPNKLKLIGTIQGEKDGERGLHKEFHHLRGNGEWFEKRPELVSVISFLIENQHPWYFCRARRNLQDVWASVFKIRGDADSNSYEDCALSNARNGAKAKAIRLRVREHKQKHGVTPAWGKDAMQSACLNEGARKALSYVRAWETA